MKDIAKNILIGVLIVIICILIFKIYNSNKNQKLMLEIEEANSIYIGNTENYHINIKTTTYMGEESTETTDIYKKGCKVKSTSSANDIIHYEETDIFESFNISENDNSIVSDSRSYVDTFTNFLETYYKNLSKSKITTDNGNYILTVENYKYYFDKETYRLTKTELFSDTDIMMETVYTYYDDEKITDEMVSRPEI